MRTKLILAVMALVLLATTPAVGEFLRNHGYPDPAVYARLFDRTATGWLPDFVGENRKTDRIEARCIITRKCEEPIPTWDGNRPATIFDPAIWHFDPDARLETVHLKHWRVNNEAIAASAMLQVETRHTLADHFLPSVPSNRIDFSRRGFADDAILPRGN